MNVMPMDYDSPPVFNDYNRYEKMTYPTEKDLETRSEINRYFTGEEYDPDKDLMKKLWQGPNGQLFDRMNSQRQFISQPVGSVPNEQMEFAQWLYGTPGNCKAGSIWDKYGVKYTDDSLLCNGYNVAEPTNQGLISGNLMSAVEK
jgi:hypothetical protein